jgi:hypothetical protein
MGLPKKEMIPIGAHKRIQLNPEYKIEQLTKEIINSSESQIVIEVPENCSLLTNEINLRLLKFYAEEEEKEFIINGVDPVLISLAQRLGISTIRDHESGASEIKPGFLNSHAQAEAETAAAPEQPAAKSITIRTSPYGKLVPAIVVLLFTLILAVWLFLQPKVVVMVYPKEQLLPFTVTAHTGTAFTDADIANGDIPAENLEQNFKVITQSTTTGHKLVGITAAMGKALVINGSNQPILLPKGSVIHGRNGIRFLTDQNVLVPKKAARIEAGIVVGESYGKVEVNITAEKKGSVGNQPAQSITVLEGRYQNLLKVINAVPTRNGADKQVAVVALDDVKKGEDEAKQQMQLAFGDEARSLINKDYLYLSDLVKTEIIHLTNKPEIGAEADSLETEIEYRITILAPTAVGIQKFLNKQFEQNIPANFEAKNRKVDLESMHVSKLNDDSASLEMVGQGQIRGLLDAGKIKNLIKGKQIMDAKDILIRQNEVADVKFKVVNSRAKLPSFGFQIKVLFPAGNKVNYRL